jgi:GntR family transcriptional regulator
MNTPFGNNEPVYLQIMRQLCYQILRGDYKPGDKLPTWVEAGLQFNVNHNTIARTYIEMARAGIVETRRGSGTYVTNDQALLDQLHESLKKELLEEFVSEMISLGYGIEELEEAFREYLHNYSESAFL